MNDIENESEYKFTLEYHLAGAQAGEPPFKYRSNFLVDALAEGWRIHLNGGIIVALSRGRELVFSTDELPEFFNQMAVIGSSQSGLSPKEIAERAIRGMGKNA